MRRNAYYSHRAQARTDAARYSIFVESAQRAGVLLASLDAWKRYVRLGAQTRRILDDLCTQLWMLADEGAPEHGSLSDSIRAARVRRDVLDNLRACAYARACAEIAQGLAPLR